MVSWNSFTRIFTSSKSFEFSCIKSYTAILDPLISPLIQATAVIRLSTKLLEQFSYSWLIDLGQMLLLYTLHRKQLFDSDFFACFDLLPFELANPSIRVSDPRSTRVVGTTNLLSSRIIFAVRKSWMMEKPIKRFFGYSCFEVFALGYSYKEEPKVDKIKFLLRRSWCTITEDPLIIRLKENHLYKIGVE